jgi:hypothetical protein
MVVISAAIAGGVAYGYCWWKLYAIQDAVGKVLANRLVHQVDGATRRKYRDVDREGGEAEDYGEVNETTMGTAMRQLEDVPKQDMRGPPSQERALTIVAPHDQNIAHHPEEYPDSPKNKGEGRVNRLIITYSRLAKIERGTPKRSAANLLSVRRLILKAMKRNCVRECDQVLVIEAAVEAVFVPNCEEVRVARLASSWGVYWRQWTYRYAAGAPSN